MSTIEVYVLKSFPWSADGYTPNFAEKHATIMLPEKLFDGLNKAGYVRRSVIGDGHVALSPSGVGENGPELMMPLPEGAQIGIAVPEIVSPPAPAGDITVSDLAAAATEVLASGGVVAPSEPAIVGEKPTETVVAAAPSPASKTAPLTDEEEQWLADGAKAQKPFFAQRSIAAKLSTEPVNNGEDVKRVIDAELKRRAEAAAL